jgi:hypothetical protein
MKKPHLKNQAGPTVFGVVCNPAGNPGMKPSVKTRYNREKCGGGMLQSLCQKVNGGGRNSGRIFSLRHNESLSAGGCVEMKRGGEGNCSETRGTPMR